jgi:uncharacterized MAPEG superfamily protein
MDRAVHRDCRRDPLYPLARAWLNARPRLIFDRNTFLGEEDMMSALASSVELQVLFCAILLGLIQLLLATLASVAGRGLPWGVGARDQGWPSIGKYGARLERAYKNFLETFPFFLGAVLLAHALDKSTHNSALGAQVYLWARVLYVPAYVSGIPFVRTLCWAASIVGILMVLRAIWPGW